MSLQSYTHKVGYVAKECRTHFGPGPITLYFRRNPAVLLEIAAARRQTPPPGYLHLASYLREDPDLPERIDVGGRKKLSSWFANQGKVELAKLDEGSGSGHQPAPFARAVGV